MSSNIFHLPASDACLRRFREKSHAISFMNGEIWMAPLARYRKMGKTNDGTGDSFEGIRSFEYEGRQFEFTSFAAENAVILSTTALVDEALKCISVEQEKKRFVVRSDFAEYSSRCSQPGEATYGVVFSASLLIDRLKQYAISHGLHFRSKLVRYTANKSLSFSDFNLMSIDGSIVDETLFRKRADYSDQYEYRFALFPDQNDIDAKSRCLLNSDGFHIVKIEPFECTGIEMHMYDERD